MSRATMDRRAGAFAIAGAALLWSTGGVAIKAVPEPPLAIAGWRSAVAAVALLAVFRPRIWRWTPGFVVAVVASAACVTSFVVATKWTTAANAIVLQYTSVVWVLLLSPRLLGEPLQGRDVLAIALAFTGMALFFVGDLDARGRAGDLIALVSGVCLAALLLALRSERALGAGPAVTYGNLLTALALAPAMAAEGVPAPASAAILVFLGVVQIAGAYVLFVRGLRSVPAAEASLIGMLEPIANPLWVFLLLGERPRPAALAGGVLVLAAVAWRTLGARDREPAVATD
jgi:drug/metabolite transporter (DMT)-like permease